MNFLRDFLMRTFTLKKLLLTTVFFLLGSLAIHAADDDGLITEQITIKLDKAGTLPNKIDKSKKYKITNLKLIGDINGTDLRLIRDMAGRDYQYNSTNGKLSELDLSEVNIVSGGNSYCFDNCYSDNNKIGSSAFESCSSLTNIILPLSTTEIGIGAFASCSSLTSINIPECVTKIGALAFSGCSNLRNINLPSTITEIEDATFNDCSSLISINIPKCVTKIGNHAFSHCSNLRIITLPDGITSLGNSCFKSCEYLGITLPDGITSIGDECFSNCHEMKSITIPNGVTSLGNSCFYSCVNLTNIILPDGITSLGNSCFENCTSLKSINLPTKLTSLGNYCFAKTTLKEITLPDAITSLGDWCFWNCGYLYMINLPAGITRLGQCCFMSCDALLYIYAGWTNPITIREDVFDNYLISAGNVYLYVPKGTVDNYKRTAVWQKFNKKIREYVPSGINNTIINCDVKEISRYSVNGLRLDKPGKGLNIVKYRDGSVKKVVVQ